MQKLNNIFFIIFVNYIHTVRNLRRIITNIYVTIIELYCLETWGGGIIIHWFEFYNKLQVVN